MTMFLLRSIVIFRYLGQLSSGDLQDRIAQFADYYGVLDTDIFVIQIGGSL